MECNKCFQNRVSLKVSLTHQTHPPTDHSQSLTLTLNHGPNSNTNINPNPNATNLITTSRHQLAAPACGQWLGWWNFH